MTGILKKLKNKFLGKSGSPSNNDLARNAGVISEKALIINSTISGKVNIGDYAKIKDVIVSGEVTIGKNTSLWGPNIQLYANVNGIVIGNFCSIASNVVMQEYNHQYDRLSSYFIFQNVFRENMKADISSKGNITIGNDVWIGTQSTILSGARIGNGAIIGANSVVSSEIPPYAIAVGSPAKVVKFRFDQPVIDRLQSLEWWNWDHKKIIANRSLFEAPLTLEKLDALK